MDFRRYESIKPYNKKIISNYSLLVPKEELWIVTEKIHGANMSIYVSKDDINFASRNGFIEDQFYQWRIIEKELIDKAKRLYEKLRYDIIIYGELFGKAKKSVQKGIYYGEKLQFYPFDIYNVNTGAYVNYLDMKKFAEEAGFRTPHILKIGTIEECANIDVNVIESFIAETDTPNYAEGIVIRPNKTYYTDKRVRLIIKKKHKNFSEINNMSTEPIKKNIRKRNISKDIQNLLNDMLRYVNHNRLNNVLSQLDDEEKCNAMRIIGLLVKDVWAEYCRDNELQMNISKKDKKYLNAQLHNETVKIYKKIDNKI